MAVKRRTVWLSDDDWSKVQAIAGARHVNVSQLVRSLVLHEHVPEPTARPAGTSAVPTARTAQAERDAILRRVNRRSV